MEPIDVGQLGPDLRKFHWDLPPASLGLSEEQAFQSPVVVDLALRKVESRVLVSGSIASRIKCKCSRCLEEFEQPVRSEVSLEYVEGPPPAVREDTVQDEDADVGYFEVPFVDPSDDLRQILLLASPAYPVCRRDCRGLCAVCGKNLNLEKCKCRSSDKVRPFEGLRTLLQKEQTKNGKS